MGEAALYFQAKYRELREQFNTLRNRFLLTVCAWCQKPIRWQLMKEGDPVYISHGICPICKEKTLSALRVMVPSNSQATPVSGNGTAASSKNAESCAAF
jgi:hypothetical protein